ncbi:MAG: helix-turn-helix transcriptional regulator [Clostridia bacterium]|nr:helix-turn-helix transcriptional regulator [Clostridia bacterium]
MLDSQYKMNLIKIGLKIAYYRKLQGMTQEELAEACDISAGYLAQLEGPNSYFCPSLKTLFKIAEVLGTTVSKLTDIDD